MMNCISNNFYNGVYQILFVSIIDVFSSIVDYLGG